MGKKPFSNENADTIFVSLWSAEKLPIDAMNVGDYMPTPPDAANAFATIVGLIGMYKHERKGADDENHQKFVEWLQYHRHEQVVNLICNTATIQSEVVSLLQQDSRVILSRLESMNMTLATILSEVQAFKGLSKAMLPHAELSEQALFILRQLFESKCRSFIYGEMSGAVILQTEGAMEGGIEDTLSFIDPLFLSEDIESLQKSGLVVERETASDTIGMYAITRAGAKLMATMDSKVSLRRAKDF